MKGLKPVKKLSSKPVALPAVKPLPANKTFLGKHIHIVFDKKLQVENLTDYAKLDQILKLIASQNLLLQKIFKAVKEGEDKKLDLLITRLLGIRTDLTSTST